MFSLFRPDPEAWRKRRRLRHVPRYLPPHLMQDIGLEPWPEMPVEDPARRRHNRLAADRRCEHA